MSASREKNKRKELNASAEAPATPAKKGMSKGLKWTIGIICLVLVIAIVTFFSMLTSGYLAGHTTAATVGSHKLSPAMVNYFYKEAYNSMSSQYGDMMSYMIDSNTPLNEQYYDEENGITWADTLIEQGLTSAARIYAIYDEAVANGETLSDDDQSSIDATVSNLSVYATYYGYSNVNGYLAAMYGTGCNEKNFREFLSIETGSGVRRLRLYIRDGKVSSVSVDMGKADLSTAALPAAVDADRLVDAPLPIAGRDWRATCVSVGNPHCVVFCDAIDGLELEKIGPEFEYAPLFPERINTEFVRVVNRTNLRMRVWERGNGETLACGTGACAAVVAAVENGLCDKGADVTVKLLGGDLIVNYTDERVTLTGGATLVYEGTFEY